MGRWCIHSISPYQPLHAAGQWVPFPLAKHRLSNILSQHQSNSQAELSKPTRENFKISKRKRTRSLFECIPIYQSNLQCDVCIPNHLMTRPVAKGRASPPWKNFRPFWKMSWTYCTHNHCFRACYRCKIWASLRKLLASLVSQAGYGSAGDCCLVTSVSYATQLSLVTITFFRFNIKF